MPWFLIATGVTLVGLVVAVLSLGRLRRARLLAEVAADGLLRSARSVGCTAVVSGTRGVLGLEPDTEHWMDVDLALSAVRFVVVTDRGALIDVRRDGPWPTSARCPGPGRLVIEGVIASPRAPAPRYRLQLDLPDAEAWAAALQ